MTKLESPNPLSKAQRTLDNFSLTFLLSVASSSFLLLLLQNSHFNYLLHKKNYLPSLSSFPSSSLPYLFLFFYSFITSSLLKKKNRSTIFLGSEFNWFFVVYCKQRPDFPLNSHHSSKCQIHPLSCFTSPRQLGWQIWSSSEEVCHTKNGVEVGWGSTIPHKPGAMHLLGFLIFSLTPLLSAAECLYSK